METNKFENSKNGKAKRKTTKINEIGFKILFPITIIGFVIAIIMSIITSF